MINTSGREVAMDPARNTVWEAYDAGAAGVLFLPPDTGRNDELATLLQQEATGENVGPHVHLPPEGAEPDIVVKEFIYVSQPGNLADLRAHVMLSGLDQVDQSDNPWRIRAIRVLGGLVFHQRSDEGVGARWVMERIMPLETGMNAATTAELFWPEDRAKYWEGREPHEWDELPALPPAAKRRALYEEALAISAYGAGSVRARLDDYDYRNTLIESLPSPESDNTQGVAVRIDITAREGFDFPK